ncbi:thiamine biosynthesis protein ThiF (plasmid) [Bacillus methanolicus]|uniref:ThiF family adenylyltransferase n=1 Tax=Bacillus methanolicus TaxID=1471 RepID=UPI0023800A1D|nr:ThiF family adenylyltransferase [Bacillus methanolicus]MDE3841010.1 thiamine biosynthesis protein ThiF [Bacillus methanolicus]
MNSVNILTAAKDNWYDYKGIFPFIVQIGVGGTGGYLVQHIAQLLGTSRTKAAYVIADPDVIEIKNLGNQLFLPQEVGLKKADVLASRYSAAYDIDIGSYSDSYIESTEHLRSLFSMEYMSMYDDNERLNKLFLPIIIGCVDNNYTRRIIHALFMQMKTVVYIDAGNEATKVPHDWRTRPKERWTEEELTSYHQSGWSGQVVTGVRLNLFKQAPVAEVFPDILEDYDEIRPSELSCSELSASEPQRLIVNKFAALSIANILTHIVEEYKIYSHITFFHAKKGYMRSTEVQLQEQQ